MSNVVSIKSAQLPSNIRSRDIAIISGKPHGALLPILRKMIAAARITVTEVFYRAEGSPRAYPEFVMNKADSLLVGERLGCTSLIEHYWSGADTHAIVGTKGQKAPPALPTATLKATPPIGAIGYLPPRTSEPTMSSLEIAELTGKRSADVMRDIRHVLGELEIDESQFASVYKDAKGEMRPCFHLPRREVEILLTGYNIPLRAKVIDRMRELEGASPAFKVPSTFRDALLLAVELEEQRAALTLQVTKQTLKIAEDAPKVEVFNKLADSSGLVGFQTFCTQLNLNQREVKHWLRDIGWLRAHQYAVKPLPTASAVDNGYCEIKNFTTEFGKLIQTIKFTGKALTYAAEKAPGYIRKTVKGAA